MLRKKVDIDLNDVDADGIVEADTAAGAEALSIAGALASGGAWTGDYARQLVITSVGNDSGITFTLVGTDADGWSQTEVVTGPNATAVETTGYFATISSITTSGATADAVDVGTVDEASSRTIMLDSRSDVAATISVDVTGTINYTVQETFDRVGLAQQSPTQNVTWQAITAFSAKTADVTSSATMGATAIRVLVNSYSSGAELQVRVNQPSSKT